MGKKTKVVIDTNIIISAFGWGGKPKIILNLVDKGEITNFISVEILNELKRVVNYRRMGFNEKLQAEIMETIFNISSLINTDVSLNIITDDPEDNKILECAVSGQAEYIISGDNHLLELKKYNGIEILTPHEFLKKRTQPH